jgi:uncharacterized protein
MSGDAVVIVAGETLLLLPERAIYWARVKTLLIADPHFGKSATFRAHAIPIPEGSMNTDLTRLTRTILRTNAETLFVLGDLLHTAQGCDEETLASMHSWREQHSNLQINLVRGNHDRHAGDPPDDWRVQCVDAPSLHPPFILSHYPIVSQEGYGLAGHLHPLAQLVGKGKQVLKLPCFWIGINCAVLPAFGSFIDGAVVHPTLGERVFVVAGKQVLDIEQRVSK